MTKVKLGAAAPDFELPATGGKTLKLSAFKGGNVVLYFYPKDKTPGCTLEGQNFRDAARQFAKLNTVILGVSRDSVKLHESFKEQEGFNFDLLSDADEKVCRLFDVIQPKMLYGKEVMGVQRSTFLIDKSGVLRRAWRKVKVEGHVDEVLAAVKALDK